MNIKPSIKTETAEMDPLANSTFGPIIWGAPDGPFMGL